MIQQFVLNGYPIIHHAYICTTIFLLSAYYAEKLGKTLIVKIALGFALFGMILGLFEIIQLLSQPAFAFEKTCLGNIYRL